LKKAVAGAEWAVEVVEVDASTRPRARGREAAKVHKVHCPTRARTSACAQGGALHPAQDRLREVKHEGGAPRNRAA